MNYILHSIVLYYDVYVIYALLYVEVYDINMMELRPLRND